MNLEIQQEVTPHDEGWWDWAIWLEGPADELEEVEFVEYILHPTFPNPVRKVSNRATKFRMATRGWGEFNIRARVHLDNDEIIRYGGIRRKRNRFSYQHTSGKSDQQKKIDRHC